MNPFTKLPRIPEPKHPLIEDVYLRRWEVRKEDLLGLYALQSNHLRYKRPKVIIDAACGPGVSAYAFAKNFPDAQVIGIDISEKAIAIAKRDFQVDNLSFIVGDVSDLGEFEEKADIVSCISSMHEFGDLEKGLGQIYSALRKGGIFYFSDLNRHYVSTLNNDGITLEDVDYKMGEEFYKIRASLSDEEFVELLQDQKRLAAFFGLHSFEDNQWNMMRFSSYVAAYTPEEMLVAVDSAGFFDIRWISPDLEKALEFNGYAFKPFS